MGNESLNKLLEDRLSYLLVERGEGKITDMRTLADDLLFTANTNGYSIIKLAQSDYQKKLDEFLRDMEKADV